MTATQAEVAETASALKFARWFLRSIPDESPRAPTARLALSLVEAAAARVMWSSMRPWDRRFVTRTMEHANCLIAGLANPVQ
jgi:hypothetical protein